VLVGFPLAVWVAPGSKGIYRRKDQSTNPFITKPKRPTRLDPTSPNSPIYGPDGLVNLTQASQTQSSINKSRPAPLKSTTHGPDGLVDLNKATKPLPKSSVYGPDGLVNLSKVTQPRPTSPEPSTNKLHPVEQEKARKKARRGAALLRAAAEKAEKVD
jgi:hypothetical protein